MYESPTDIIRRAAEYLGQPLPDSKKELTAHLVGLESILYDLGEKKAEWGRVLAEKKSQMLHPKDKDVTELDRKILLNASVGVIQQDYDFLCRIEEIADNRIAFGRQLLS